MTPQVVHCTRCHVPCRTGTPDAKARLLQHSAGPRGLCQNCAVTQFFQDEEYGVSLEWILCGSDELDGTPGKEVTKALLLPHIQKQFAEILQGHGPGDDDIYCFRCWQEWSCSICGDWLETRSELDNRICEFCALDRVVGRHAS